MSDPFTIRIFVPDGDPEGVRIIDRMNWTGLGIVFPRDAWDSTKRRPEFEKAGVYVLVGYSGDDDLPTLYVGQADGLRKRIDQHAKAKDFWDWACVFASANDGLNRAHVTWLEWALISQAVSAGRSRLDNGNIPQEPALSESEKADTRGFFKEILQILPLVGLRAFEQPKVVVPAKPSPHQSNINPSANDPRNMIIVPAQKDGFESVFLGENCWYAIRISGGMLHKIRWIAGYQTQPISAITHVAEVAHIEPYGEGGKYKLIFKRPAQKLENPIPYSGAPMGAMQGPRYSSYERLQQAKTLSDLL